jgi:hypothetical protein
VRYWLPFFPSAHCWWCRSVCPGGKRSSKCPYLVRCGWTSSQLLIC